MKGWTKRMEPKNRNDLNKLIELGKNFGAAARFLQETDLMSLAPGKYNVDGEAVMASVKVYTPALRGEGTQFEVHHDYADIQYVIQGEEAIVICSCEDLQACGEFDEKSDIQFFAGQDQGEMIALHSHQYLVVLPGIPHMSGISQSCIPVKKIIVKVKMQG